MWSDLPTNTAKIPPSESKNAGLGIGFVSAGGGCIVEEHSLSFTWQRTVGSVILLAAGIFSLPVAAFFLDNPGTENLIVPVQLLVMGLIGALIGRFLPGLAGPKAGRRQGMMVGSLVGLLAALVGIVVFFFLVSGISGA